MEDFVISIPEAIAIVGSIGTIVFGVFMYLLKIRGIATKKPVEVDQESPRPHYIEAQVQILHERASSMKDRVLEMDSDIRLMNTKLDNIQKGIEDHEERDVRDFSVLNKKIEKLTDIVIKILSDDKL